MSGRIPENILEDILSRVNLVEIISEFLPLKRAGKNFRAHCPFHQEKTPSFMISPDRQIFHCFGCGESGNAIGFLMRHERMEFLEAVEYLAKKAGVNLPQVHREDKRTISFGAQLYKINEITAEYYERNLGSSAGQAAKKYYLQRGLKESSIEKFRLGFAADSWDGLFNYLRAKNITVSLIEKAGLLISKDSGGYYDRFRGRLIFPIFDIKTRIVGFGARVISSQEKPQAKYINSPETIIYTKGRNLYGLNFSKDAIRQSDLAVIVEGYLDMIIPFQEGMENIVASQGTALTSEQIRLIRRYTHNAVVVFDSDAAGELAALRSLDMFIEEGMSVKVACLPKGYDPDLFVRKNGIAAFRQLIENSINLFEYKMKVLTNKFNLKNIEDKAKIAQEMLFTINKFKNAVIISEYVRRLSDILKIKEEALLVELGKVKPENSNKILAPNLKDAVDLMNPTEMLLIRLMLEENELIHKIREHLTPDDFQDSSAARIVSLMFDLIGQGKNVEISMLLNHFDDAKKLKCLCSSAFEQEVTLEHKEKVVEDCIKTLKRKKLINDRLRLQEEIKIAEDLGDQEKLNLLKDKFCNLIKGAKDK